MKNAILMITIFVMLFGNLSESLHAFENKLTHPAITEQAANPSDDVLTPNTWEI